MDNIPIYFYIPAKNWSSDMPLDYPRPWSKLCRGAYAWTLQTYLYLKIAGFPCKLVKEMPYRGIVISHRDFLSENFKPREEILLVSIQAERSPHPYAQFHVVQNPIQSQNNTLKSSPFFSDLEKKHFIRHWPQIGLVPRNLSKTNDVISNIAYFGRKQHIHSFFKSEEWKIFLNKNNLNFQMKTNPESWNNYSDIDAVVAVRQFHYETAKKLGKYPFISKPATKLYNAWHAGVIPIMGYESAFFSERKTKFDYIEVFTKDELKKEILKLKHDSSYRNAILQAGKARAKEINSQSITQEWINLIENEIKPCYHEWTSKKQLSQKMYILQKDLLRSFNRLTNKIQQVTKY